MKQLLTFGNPDMEDDSLALRLGEELKREGLEVVRCSQPDDILQYPEGVILDVAQGVKDVTLLTNGSLIKASGISTLHDFDVGFFLKIMESTGSNPYKVIAIPQKGELPELKEKVLALIKEKVV